LSREDADITRPDQVDAALRRHRPDVVINSAAYTAVDQAEDEHDAAFRVNLDGATILAAACAVAEVPLIHISTDYVFDGTKADAYVESDIVDPIGVYGKSKAAGEAAVRSGAPKHVIVRTAWLYGEFGNNFLRTILRLAGERDELRIVADQYGTPTSTGALANAILSIVPRICDNKALWGTYHFTGTGVTSWHGFAEWIVGVQARYTGHQPRVVAIASDDWPTRATRPANSALDSSLFHKTFGIGSEHWTIESERVITALLSREGNRMQGLPAVP
jgi:dTDP-4-dehydrorhamnose reductase